MKRIPLLVALGLALLVVPGCSSGPRVVRVTGTVTYAGQPVAGLFVHFMPDKGRPSWGKTDEAGKYDLHYAPDQMGAIEGKHRIYFTYGPASMEEEMAMAKGKIKKPAALDKILKRYGNVDVAKLDTEVKQDGQVINWDLKD
jgi:hypothetical protein